MSAEVYMVHKNWAGACFVKTLEFFEQQGGNDKEWGKAWHRILANDIEDARRICKATIKPYRAAIPQSLSYAPVQPAFTSTAAPERIWVDPQSYAICSIHPRSDGVVYVRASSAPRLTPEQARTVVEKICAESDLSYLLCIATDEEKNQIANIITTELLRIDNEANE